MGRPSGAGSGGCRARGLRADAQRDDARRDGAGGMALAVSILVNDATVTIERIEWHLEQSKPVLARFLFVPLAVPAVSAMIASFVLSRTLVPTMAMYTLRRHDTHSQLARATAFKRFQIVSAGELGSLADNIGLPVSSINSVYVDNGAIGPQDGDGLITLLPGLRPTDDVAEDLRRQLARRFPGTVFAFLPADITSQILNFGAPAPIDVVVTGKDMAATRRYAEVLAARVARIAGIADPRIQQPARAPEYTVDSLGELVAVAGDVQGAIQALKPPKGITVTIRSQYQTMQTAFTGLGLGIVAAVALTALAMVIGMAPMALGLGEDGEQNAPLGRAWNRRPRRRPARACPRRCSSGGPMSPRPNAGSQLPTRASGRRARPSSPRSRWARPAASKPAAPRSWPRRARSGRSARSPPRSPCSTAAAMLRSCASRAPNTIS